MKVFNPKYKTSAARWGKPDGFIEVEAHILGEDFLYAFGEEDTKGLESEVAVLASEYLEDEIDGEDFIVPPNFGAGLISPKEAREQIMRWAKMLADKAALAEGIIHITNPFRTCTYVFVKGYSGRVDEADPFCTFSGGKASRWELDGKPVTPPIPTALREAIEKAVWKKA